MPYLDRLDALKSAGIGLWDVIAHATRPGSLDAAIRDAAAADLNQLVLRLPDVRAIAFNGATAARIGRRTLEPHPALRLIDLPSSSAAYTRSWASKAEDWAILKPFSLTV